MSGHSPLAFFFGFFFSIGFFIAVMGWSLLPSLFRHVYDINLDSSGVFFPIIAPVPFPFFQPSPPPFFRMRKTSCAPLKI